MTNKIIGFFSEEVKEKEIKHECPECGRKYETINEAEKCFSTHDCCIAVKDKKKGFINGIYYGLVPHTFCILFIIGAVLGATFLTTLFKPLLMSRNFFYILIALSFGFATISALLYLKRNNCLCASGARKRWKFLSILYATTIAVNLLFFFAIFPAVANIGTASAASAEEVNDLPELSKLTLDVDIPCSGHAPLIIGELKTIEGVKDVKYVYGKFEVYYDSPATKEKILALDVFKEYPATVLDSSTSFNSESSQAAASSSIQAASISSSPGSGSGCGGSCGGCGGGCSGQ